MGEEYKTYVVHMRDDGDGDETVTIVTTAAEIRQRAERLLTDWVECGDRGDDGARVHARCVVKDETGAPVGDRIVCVVDVEPDHEKLMAAAGADPDCRHQWCGEEVRSVGGTAVLIRATCSSCGLRREEYRTGLQYHPGEYDTVTYAMPDGVA